MRIFNQVVFDSYVAGTNSTYTDSDFDGLLASAEKLSLQAIVDQISGTSPTITVAVEHSSDRRNWTQKNGGSEISGTSVTAPSDVKYGQDTGTVPGLAFSRLRIYMGGTGSVGARIRVFATGHAEAMPRT